VKVPAAWAGYDWQSRTIQPCRGEIRSTYGFRANTEEDHDRLAAWLATELGPAVQVLDVVRGGERVGRQSADLLEDLLSPPAGEPGPTGTRAHVGRRRAGRGLVIREEQRAAGTAADQSGQQLDGAGLAVNPLVAPPLAVSCCARPPGTGLPRSGTALRRPGRRTRTASSPASSPGARRPSTTGRRSGSPPGPWCGQVARSPLDVVCRIAIDPALALPAADRRARDGRLPIDGVGVPLVRPRRRRPGRHLRQHRVVDRGNGEDGGPRAPAGGPVGAGSPRWIRAEALAMPAPDRCGRCAAPGSGRRREAQPAAPPLRREGGPERW
jgi:hypothetical protein